MKHAYWTILFVTGLFVAGLLPGTTRAAEPAKAPQHPTYERDVRPILKAYCFQCHGEEAELKGELDLRLRRLIATGGESGQAIVPGNVKKSLLYERIVSGEMPPGEAKLSAKQIRTIAEWIRTGAKTLRPEPLTIGAESFTEEERAFWSLQPIQRPAVPAFGSTDRVRTPVDAFVLARLHADKLNFSPEADRVTLIRRLYFDLLGLPPTPEAIEQFLTDNSPDAYEKLVDRLLASPRYGERWGRHWLDVAGYADSEGYTEADPERDSAFRYRDYVIRAFNDDKPFDTFILEQLAGDELVKPPYRNLTPEQIDQLVATGFLRMAPDGTGMGSVDQGIARNQVIAETLKIVSTSLMGLTVGCAQCHNHRYDPIPQADYYRLRAIFEPAYDWKSWRTPAARRISLYTDDDRRVAATIEAEAKLVDAELAKQTAVFIDQTLDTQLAKLPEDVREPLRVAYKTPAAKRTVEHKEVLDRFPKILKISAGSLYLYDREIRTDAAKIDADRKTKEKAFVAKAFQAELAKLPAEIARLLQTAHATAAAMRTAEQKKLVTEHAAHLVTLATLRKFDAPAADELARLQKAATDLRATQKADRVKAMQAKAAAVRARKPPEGFVRPLAEVSGTLPKTFLFSRGDHEQPKQELAPAGLSLLADRKLGDIPTNDTSITSTGRRLAFAQRLTNGRHPLTARVLVNRFWMHHFGRGIVETPGDFGYLGARPSHPQLLDWLAAEFMQGGWRVKRIHRLMLTSTVYRQSSRRLAELNSVDPDNHLYGRMPIRRLESEVVRDAVLAISGTLNDKLFGKPVPVMEDDVGQIILGKENLDGERKPGAKIDLLGEEYRRSLYVQVRRSRPLGVLSTFDAPVMDPNCTSRNSSTVAPQALMMMNSDFTVAYAGRFAERVVAQVGDDHRKQTAHAWLLAYGRKPTKEQVDAALQFLTTQEAYYTNNPPAGSKTAPQKLALSSFCQALIGSNGFLYID